MRLITIIFLFFSFSAFAQNGNGGNFNGGSFTDEECIEEIASVNALLVERNASRLTVGCTYKVTQDFVQCIGEITIFFKAIDVNEVSQDISAIKGTLNFEGRFDLDQSTNGFLELEDDRGNEAEGNAAIKRFPWESTRVRNTKVEEDAVWFCDCFPNYNHYDNRHLGNSTLYAVGVTGYIYSSTFQNTAILTGTNSYLAIDDSNFEGNFSCDCDNAVNYTSLSSTHTSSTHDYNGGAKLYFNRFNTSALANIRNDDADVSFYYGNAASTLLRYRSGAFQSYYSDYDSYANMDKQNTGLTYMYMMNMGGRARVINTIGALADRHYYSTYNSYADVDINNSDFYGLGNHFDSRANVDILNCENMDMYYNDFHSLLRGEFNDNIGLTYVYGNTGSTYSEYRIENNNNGRFYYCDISGTSLIRITGGTSVQVNSCSAHNTSRQYYSAGTNSRNSTLAYAFLYAHTNGNTITASMLHGRITITTTANNANRSEIIGHTSTVPFN